MPDYSDTTADQKDWKPIPVPTENVSAQCRLHPILITFKSDRTGAIGWVLRPGEAIPIKSGQAGWIKPRDALNGVLVIESIG